MLKRTALLAIVLIGAHVPLQGADERTVTVVMLGDSTTLCQGSPKGKKVTDQVEEGLRARLKDAKVTVINSGQGSDTAKGGLARFARDVLAHKPDVVTISFGLNDTGVSTPEEFEKSLRGMIDQVRKASKAKVILVTSTPFDNKRHAWGQKFAGRGGLDEFMNTNFCARMRTLAKEMKVGLCDLHEDFASAFKKDPPLLAKVIQGDGVHLTDEGNALAAKHLTPKIVDTISGK